MAIDNGAADDGELHVLALGLLTLLLRARDGDDVTVEGISKRRKEGREALAGAMRNLVSRAYVVKFKVHGADGKWRTEFTADSIPFTRDDITEMLPEVSAGARAVRVEPEWLDPRTDDRPTGTRRPVATSKNEASSQVGTTYGIPTVGPTTVGSAAAKKIKTVKEDSLSGSRDSRDASPPEGEREAAASEGNSVPADALCAVPAPRDGQADDGQPSELLEMLLGLPGRERMNRDEVAEMLLPLAVEAIAVGWTAPKLRTHLARGCDPERVYDPAAIYRKHLKKLPPAPASASGHPAAAAPQCSKCNGSGLAEDPETFLPIGPCECRKAPALAAP
ncbi:hypothetical protein [Streptomyces sp. IBSBF 2806]|uniref:hypothetical protein n=1 Tax=Streptomyces sp. IBSBF 2806 TaxID=2903529 RepID=UPI002FDBB48A